MRWELFCRVIDNHGDVGVSWRLACDLAGRGHGVRLWVDDARALTWIAPRGAPGVEVRPWPVAAPQDVGDVVVEAFGCALPTAFVEAMARRHPPPVWINLEYLSAEPYVERSHGLPSPIVPGLPKWFFYPGFTPGTGGLLREPGLRQRQAAFDGRAWLLARGWAAAPDERVVSLFCYRQPRLADWVPPLAERPTLLLATPGPATEQARALPPRAGLRTVELPWLTQADYDRLLWSCDLNFVRGEDSLVRACWAGAPLLWQLYPQHDGAHAGKLEAFADLYLRTADGELAAEVRQALRLWNGLTAGTPLLPQADAWRACHRAWRSGLLEQDDLTTRLCRFVSEKGPPIC